MHHQTIRPATVAHLAAALLSEHGENRDYDLALAELTASALGWPLELTPEALRMLRRQPRRQFCDDCPPCNACGDDRAVWTLDNAGLCDDCLPAAWQD